MPSFPERFQWGMATAAHQVEDNNINSDFRVMDHPPGPIIREPRGDACDRCHQYRQEFKMLKDLGFNTYRFSVEWGAHRA